MDNFISHKKRPWQIKLNIFPFNAVNRHDSHIKQLLVSVAVLAVNTRRRSGCKAISGAEIEQFINAARIAAERPAAQRELSKQARSVPGARRSGRPKGLRDRVNTSLTSGSGAGRSCRKVNRLSTRQTCKPAADATVSPCRDGLWGKARIRLKTQTLPRVGTYRGGNRPPTDTSSQDCVTHFIAVYFFFSTQRNLIPKAQATQERKLGTKLSRKVPLFSARLPRSSS